jgi:hypothetical protein
MISKPALASKNTANASKTVKPLQQGEGFVENRRFVETVTWLNYQ